MARRGGRDAGRGKTVAVIGAGRLGTAFALALSRANYEIVAVVARTTSHARRAAKLIVAESEEKKRARQKRSASRKNTSRTKSPAPRLNAATHPPPPQILTNAQLASLPNADIFLITTPDDAIADTAARLADEWQTENGAGENVDEVHAERNESRPRSRARVSRRPVVVLHASGALTSEVLAPLRAAMRGVSIGSLHPLVSVSDAAAGAESLREAYFCVEGDAQAQVAARRLVRSLGARSFSVNAHDKALYHAAAVMTSGHAVALFDVATELLTRCGLTDAEARRILLPLLRTTLENLSSQTPSRALTGTFARADLSTVRRHLDALAGSPDTKDALDVYKLLGRRSLRLARERGVDAEALEKIAGALEGETKQSRRK